MGNFDIRHHGTSRGFPQRQSRHIEQAWSRKPFNVYGATEPAGIASECERHTGLHLYEDLVITEVVDEDNQPVPDGSYGEKVLVTVLFSRTQPLIRYEMSDSVRLSSVACPCGRPFALLDAIQGRQEDIVYLPGSTGTPAPIHPNVFHRTLELVPASVWQVIHDRTGLRVLLVGARDDFNERSLLTAISQALEAQGAMPIEIRVERVAAIPRTTTGTFLRYPGGIGFASLSEWGQGSRTMGTTEIARESWAQTLNRFSAIHEGWLVSLDVLDPAIGAQPEIKNLPFMGISTDRIDDDGTILISAARSAAEHITHTIHSVTGLYIQHAQDGAEAAMKIESGDGTTTILRFRAAALPGPGGARLSR